jgi:hypothetical protein
MPLFALRSVSTAKENPSGARSANIKGHGQNPLPSLSYTQKAKDLNIDHE